MFKNISFVSLSFLYANIIGYIFHFYVSRKLSPAGYGEFMVLYSLMLTVGNISSIFTTITIKTVVENFKYKYLILRYLRKIGLMIGMLIGFSGIIFSPFIKDFLKISFLPYIWLISISWIFMFLLAVERGFLQAIDRFDLSSLSVVFELTFRLLMTIFLLYIGFYIWGALFPSLFGVISAFILLIFINKNIFGKLKKVSIKNLLNIALYTSPSGFIIYLDDIFLKRIFDAKTAGFYASSSIIGKALIYFSVTIFSVFFPKLVATKNNNKDFIKISFISMGFIWLIFSIAYIAVYFKGKDIFLILFGNEFLDGFKILPNYIIAVLPVALSIILIGIKTAQEKGVILIYLHIFCYFIGFFIFHFNGINEYLIYIFSINLLFVMLYIYTLFCNGMPTIKQI